MSTFRAPPIALLGWIRLTPDREHLIVSCAFPETHALNVDRAEELLEVLLDICPNAEALAHNWLLEVQKREHMSGGLSE